MKAFVERTILSLSAAAVILACLFSAVHLRNVAAAGPDAAGQSPAIRRAPAF